MINDTKDVAFTEIHKIQWMAQSDAIGRLIHYVGRGFSPDAFRKDAGKQRCVGAEAHRS
jgi:hypothetical protein